MGEVRGNGGSGQRALSARGLRLAALAAVAALAAGRGGLGAQHAPHHEGHQEHGDHAQHAARAQTAVLPPQLTTDGGKFSLRLRASPDPIRLNEYFELVVEVSADALDDDRNPYWVDTRALMPAHAHGMNTLPRREDLGSGRFLFRGMLFHMAGEWELTFDVAKGRAREHASVRLVVE
jgi:hypothetical protein